MRALAGRNEFVGGFGSVHAANITPDEATGIGAWTDAEIADSIRFGTRPASSHDAQGLDDGTPLFIMPKYAGMSDRDVADLVAFLRTLEPVSNDVPTRSVNFPIQPFTPAETPPAEAPTEAVARGQYIASIVGCGNCHTPSLSGGSKDNSLFLAGAPFRGGVAHPTSHQMKRAGLGS